MSMTFAVTAKGFLKEKITTVVDKTAKVEYFWTNKIREAKQFNSRGKVVNFLKENNLEGFAFNPNEEEPIRGKYVVVKRQHYSFEGEKHEVNEWMIQKASMLSRSDAKFLNGQDNLSNFYDKEEAEAIAIERNQKMVIELIEKIEKAKQSPNIKE